MKARDYICDVFGGRLQAFKKAVILCAVTVVLGQSKESESSVSSHCLIEKVLLIFMLILNVLIIGILQRPAFRAVLKRRTTLYFPVLN